MRSPIVVGVLLIASPAWLAGQRPLDRDTVPIDAIVVTADRSSTPLATTVSATSVITRTQLDALRPATLADALRQVPGFGLVDFDGLGYDPQLMVRGFYGGGEAEYVVVLLDGRPLNDVQSGLVAWDAIPLAAAERVEVVRGGASALWGDAAIGGVINVVTRAAADPFVRWHVAGGSHGSWRGGANARGTIGGRDVSVFGGVDRTDGFRDHAVRTTGRAGGTLTLASSSTASLRLNALAHWRTFDDPGPLADADLAVDRAASDVFYRFDDTSERTWRLGLDAEHALGERARISAGVTGDLRDTESVRTIVLAPDFADTKERVFDSARGVATVQLERDGTGLPVADHVLAGIDASYATLDSRYHTMLSGDRAAYGTATGDRGAVESRGSGNRGSIAAFVQYSLFPVDAVRITAGARMDWLRDAFDAREPAAESFEASHRAFSPRIGMNVGYVRNDTHAGNVYVSASRSFKAPTLDQLFDLRQLPVPFPPFAVTTSNAALEPQHGVNVEAGVFHRSTLVPGRVDGEITVAVYQMDMENELDFDVQTLRYVNIGRSRHRGVEAGVRLLGPGSGTAFVNYTLQNVTARSGDHAGNRLKAVPRHTISGGWTIEPIGRLETGLVVSHARGVFLDDANTRALSSYTRLDGHLSHPVAGMRLFLGVRNLLDASYSTTGFPDPSGSGAYYYRPAAGRTIELGVRSGG